ncbi:MAG: efflux RND transporter permease subunit, partial [Desulfocucumaceae bacterium]
MKLTELAIKRPIMMSMVFMLFIFLGLISVPRIGVDLYPPVNIPYVSVIVRYAGAGPEEIETQVIKPIEDSVSSLNNIKSINSTASQGLARIVIEFSLEADLDISAVDVQKSIDSISWSLPRDAESPTVKKFDFNADPVMIMALSGKLPQEEIYAIAKDQLKDRLQHLPGVAQVDLRGKEREIKVSVDRGRLERYGLTIGSLVGRIAAQNMNIPAGRIDQTRSEYLVRILGEFNDLDQLRNMYVPLPGGGQVMLSDIAAVSYGFKDIRSYSRFNGMDAVAITIQKQSSANMVSTADAINKELPALRKLLPAGVDLTVAIDNSTFVHQSINETWMNLIEGILTTGLVLFFFLREWRSTFIVTLAIPTSIIATLTMMYFAGFSFNLLTLLAMATCIGI